MFSIVGVQRWRPCAGGGTQHNVPLDVSFHLNNKNKPKKPKKNLDNPKETLNKPTVLLSATQAAEVAVAGAKGVVLQPTGHLH